MAQQQILVTGASGNLGQDLLARLALFDRYQTVGTTSTQLDLSWPEADIHWMLDTIQPTVIINTAAFTHVDHAETQFDKAMAVNAQGPSYLASWAKQHNAFLIHISTDYVFDGCKGTLYEATDLPHPINRYGESKLAGEQAIQSLLPEQSAIVRTSWLFGAGAKNFVPFLVQAAQTQQPVRVVTDQWGIPTWTGNLCKMLLNLVDSPRPGIFHGCSLGLTTRYEQALFICEALGVSSDFITPVTTDTFGFSATRPENTGMLSSFAEALTWQEATQRFLMTQGLLKTHV